MNRTHEYYRIAQAHRDALRAIWATYEETMNRLERYKGSAGYDDDEREAARVRDEAIKAQGQVTGKAFDQVLKSMREKVGGHVVAPPSDDELRLLQVLKMREKISKEELQSAGRALQDNTVALHALDDIAQAHGHHAMFIKYPAWRDSENTHQEKIASLTESARRMIRMTKPDNKRDVYTAAFRHEGGDLRSIRVDRDFDSERDAIEWYGNISDADFDTFASAVND